MKELLKVPINIPNILTIARLLMVPIFVWRYLTAHTQGEFIVAGVILLLSGITDVLDGTIARLTNSITRWGMAVDPVADKLTQLAVIGCLWIRYPNLWPIFVPLVLKEMLIMVGGWRLYKQFEFVGSSKWFGKLATVVFYLVMILVVMRGDIQYRALIPMLGVIFMLMLFSLVMYMRGYMQFDRGQKNKSAKEA